ncbi:hypothetical protein ES288_A11G364400v1 [Gossypium darwinii]|uniref:Uncharacterized protein n=1 Tax=Gossypium darwinii TaxID=34276 RepID=A0A5D2ESE0_GOSDA|nr:hypothetical protein ES288_A11G364400v1 [Gossypium darwinii]
MAFSTRCCLNMSPPTPNPQLDNSCSNIKGSQVAWPRNDKWKTGCVVGLACMIIGLEASDVSKTSEVAEEIPTVIVSESNSRVARWSDKRMCPPWQLILWKRLCRRISRGHRLVGNGRISVSQTMPQQPK